MEDNAIDNHMAVTLTLTYGHKLSSNFSHHDPFI